MEKKRKIKKPWPTKDAMQQVYAMQLWGKNESAFYSGDGSHEAILVEPYLEVIASFLKSFKSPLSVCDLGCGDFNIGKHLVPYTKQYIAVDIVPELIQYNQETFNESKLTFQCLDIAQDDLPSADCALVRQVLQHLSNVEIQSIVTKLRNYQYVILTEHIPQGEFEANKEIISGQGIRLKKKSGVNLLAAPFNFKVKESKEILSVDLGETKGRIVTTLYILY